METANILSIVYFRDTPINGSRYVPAAFGGGDNAYPII